uniref:Uncharacterized protein n=1 Tax=Vespula pensylvanica TaxID=30213 RepID=A0A834NZY4_VESPE|nr:hypothetical protein H0235_008416 [Vespula pensylvanica]
MGRPEAEVEEQEEQEEQEQEEQGRRKRRRRRRRRRRGKATKCLWSAARCAVQEGRMGTNTHKIDSKTKKEE